MKRGVEQTRQPEPPVTDPRLLALWAEVQALGLLLPGLMPLAASAASEADHEAQMEAAFDNMPV
jgi:hypothetical protein